MGNVDFSICSMCSNEYCRKEAQKCFCEAPTCRGWLGEEPEDEDDDEEGSEEEEEEEEELTQSHKEQVQITKIPEILKEEQAEEKILEPVTVGTVEETEIKAVVKPIPSESIPETPKKEKKKSPKRKIRKDKFEDLDVSLLANFVLLFMILLNVNPYCLMFIFSNWMRKLRC